MYKVNLHIIPHILLDVLYTYIHETTSPKIRREKKCRPVRFARSSSSSFSDSKSLKCLLSPRKRRRRRRRRRRRTANTENSATAAQGAERGARGGNYRMSAKWDGRRGVVRTSEKNVDVALQRTLTRKWRVNLQPVLSLYCENRCTLPLVRRFVRPPVRCILRICARIRTHT